MPTICREACINFKDLCKKKDADGLWMEELTAMQACSPSELSYVEASGIVLTTEISAHNQRAVFDSSKSSVSTIKGVPNESFDTSKSGSSTSQASLHSKKGIIHCCIAYLQCYENYFSVIQVSKITSSFNMYVFCFHLVISCFTFFL